MKIEPSERRIPDIRHERRENERGTADETRFFRWSGAYFVGRPSTIDCRCASLPREHVETLIPDAISLRSRGNVPFRVRN